MLAGKLKGVFQLVKRVIAAAGRVEADPSKGEQMEDDIGLLSSSVGPHRDAVDAAASHAVGVRPAWTFECEPV